jgi:hypothetical protein
MFEGQRGALSRRKTCYKEKKDRKIEEQHLPDKGNRQKRMSKLPLNGAEG